MPECTCTLGQEIVTQDVSLPASGQGQQYGVTDLTIPTGKVVAGAGGAFVTIDGAAADGSNAWLNSALACAEVQSGPHPTDSTKWRFLVSTAGGQGGLSRSSVIRVWLVVVIA